MRNTVRLAARTGRRRSSRSSIRGWRARSSQTAQAASSAAETAPVARRLAADPPVAWLHLEGPACRRTLSLVWRADAYLSAAARALISFAISHFDTWRGDA